MICNLSYALLQVGKKKKKEKFSCLLPGTTSSNFPAHIQFHTSPPTWLLPKPVLFHLTSDPISGIDVILIRNM